MFWIRSFCAFASSCYSVQQIIEAVGIIEDDGIKE